LSKIIVAINLIHPQSNLALLKNKGLSKIKQGIRHLAIIRTKTTQVLVTFLRNQEFRLLFIQAKRRKIPKINLVCQLHNINKLKKEVDHYIVRKIRVVVIKALLNLYSFRTLSQSLRLLLEEKALLLRVTLPKRI